MSIDIVMKHLGLNRTIEPMADGSGLGIINIYFSSELMLPFFVQTAPGGLANPTSETHVTSYCKKMAYEITPNTETIQSSKLKC